MKLIHITEARKNPELNPSISPLNQLKQIAQEYGTDNIFCRFVNIPMLKNTILSEYDTPLGMCSYPLDYTIKYNITGVPFASNAAYILVFRPTSFNKIWVLDNSRTAEIATKMLKAITRMLGIQHESNIKFDSDKELWYYMYDAIRSVSSYDNKAALLARNILTSVGLIGVNDPGNGILHKNEPTQAVFFNVHDLQLLSTITNASLNQTTIDNIYSQYRNDYTADRQNYTILRYIITKLRYDWPDNKILRLAAKIGNKVVKIDFSAKLTAKMISPTEAQLLSKYGFNLTNYIKIFQNSGIGIGYFTFLEQEINQSLMYLTSKNKLQHYYNQKYLNIIGYNIPKDQVT